MWTDRRRARESPHYMLGLNFLVANQIDPAIDELQKAAQVAGDPLEIHLILGNLYREKGQVGRAIQEHQNLLQRSNLRKLEHANVLLCLGLDYRRGGFVDRAIEAFTEVLRLDPRNQYAIANLEKLYEEQHQWTDAYAARGRGWRHCRRRARRLPGTTRFWRSSRTSSARRRSSDWTTPRRLAVSRPPTDLDARNAPALLSLGDVRRQQGSRPRRPRYGSA